MKLLVGLGPGHWVASCKPVTSKTSGGLMVGPVSNAVMGTFGTQIFQSFHSESALQGFGHCIGGARGIFLWKPMGKSSAATQGEAELGASAHRDPWALQGGAPSYKSRFIISCLAIVIFAIARGPPPCISCYLIRLGHTCNPL